MTDEPPRTLADLRAVSDPAVRARAAKAYIQQRQDAIDTAIGIRDNAIRELLREGYGPTEVGRRCDVSVSTVKVARVRADNPVL